MQKDTLVFDLIRKELERQRHGIELIASENFTSLQVMQAMGTVLTNKYAEGYPGRRYYGGCEIVDQVEQLAIDRLKQIFDCEYANVQPHSGAQANAALMLAILQPGDTILGLLTSSHGDAPKAVAANTQLPQPAASTPMALPTADVAALSRALAAKGIDQDIAQRAQFAYQRSMSLPPNMVLATGI